MQTKEQPIRKPGDECVRKQGLNTGGNQQGGKQLWLVLRQKFGKVQSL